MHKYKYLQIDDLVRIVESADPFTKTITSKLIGELGVITNIVRSPGAQQAYIVYIDALKIELYLQRDALTYHSNVKPFKPLHRVLADGTVIEAAISGRATKSNKSVIHTLGHIAIYPRCGSRSNLEYYDIGLDLAPNITCQKCLSIMYHKRRKLLESL